MNCREMNTKLAGLLLDPDSATPEVLRHIEECGRCGEELAQLRATMALMDDWSPLEPSPFFDAKLLSRLRAEREASPAGLLARWKWWFQYGTRLRIQQLAIGALALALVVGGGTYADIAWQAQSTQESATLHDLQSLDSNAEVYQQLDSVDQGTGQPDQGPAIQPGSPSSD
jgi:anti-sigma factor RsiW